MSEYRVRLDQDLKKQQCSGPSNSLSDQIKRSAAATSDLVGGVASAVAEGFKSYNEAITPDNVMVLGLNNGFVEGTVAGYARFFERMAGTARDVLSDIQRPAPVAAVSEPDPARLARHIALHLRADQTFIDAIASRVQTSHLSSDQAFIDAIAARVKAKG